MIENGAKHGDFEGFGGRARIVLVAATALAVVAAACALAPAWAGSRGDCITLEVDAPILLPGETSAHPPGMLTLCDSMRISPVSTIHKTYIDGHPVAMLSSRRTSSESGERTAPHALFSRDEQGQLTLFGYVLPGKGRSVTYVLDESKRPVRRRSGAAGTALADNGEPPSSRVDDRDRTPQDEDSTTIAILAARTPR